jgi:trigger factor
MQVNETLAEGLKRELTVTVPATDLDSRLSDKLVELKSRVRLNGFRPGKVPIAHLRKLYGKSAMAEIVETMVTETSRTAITDRDEKAAMQPEIAMTEDEAEAGKILDGDADLVFTMVYEVLPDFEIAGFKDIAIERQVVDVTDEEINERLKQIGEGNRTYESVSRKARDGDRITMSYAGKIEGEPFEGGTDQDAQITIGSGQFIPGFEEGLTGARAGEEKTIDVTFPDDYQAAHLAGKAAEFSVEIKDVAEPGEIVFDDEFAKRLGVESMDKLRETVTGQVESEFGIATRQKVKRQILDALDELHIFDLPENLVSQEFDNIWQQITGDIEQRGKTFEDEGTSEEKARAEYQAISERRVRLGLVLSRIGEEAEVEVSEEELQRSLYAHVRQFPGQEQQVLDYYKKNPTAIQELRAPIFEDKTIDYIMEFADVTEKTVTKEELLADQDEDDHEGHDHDHDH